MMVKREETNFALIKEVREMFSDEKEDEDKDKWAFPGSGGKEGGLSEEFQEETRLAFRSVSYSWSDTER